MAIRGLIVWLGFMAIAIMNGALREMLLVPRLGIGVGHVISTVLLAAAIAVITGATIGWIGAETTAQAGSLGVTWLVLTLAFEFSLGRARGMSWSELLHDYDISDGRIWILVPVVILVAPIVWTLVRRQRG